MFTFALAVILLVGTPGPGVLSAAAVGAAYGFKAGSRYITGLFIGNALVGLIVILGIAALLLANPYLRYILLLCSTLYILWLAKKVAFAGVDIEFHEASSKPGIREGTILQLINPKSYIVNSTFFAGFVIWPSNYTAEVAAKFLVFYAIWYPIHYAWLMLGIKIRQLNLDPTFQRGVNWVMATSLVVVVIIATWSTLKSGL